MSYRLMRGIMILSIYILLEMLLFIFIIQQIGWLNTILLSVITLVIGIFIVKKQGRQTLRKVQEQMYYGETPGPAILDGVCVFIGSIFLIIPGLLSNVVALALLIPVTRKWIKPLIIRLLSKMFSKGRFIHYRL